MSPKLRHSVPAAGIAELSFDRARVHNALDGDVVDALHAALSQLGDDGSIRAVVLASTTPGLFCAGADLSVPDEERRRVSDELYALYERIVTLPVPVLAAVDGPAVGGGAQLALAADVRLGSPRTRFRFAGPGHGLAVGPWALPSTIGRRALELVLSQRFIGGDEAAELGLLDRLTDDPLAEAIALASHVGELDREAVRRAKEHVVRGERLVERLDAERVGNVAVFDGVVRRTPHSET